MSGAAPSSPPKSLNPECPTLYGLSPVPRSSKSGFLAGCETPNHEPCVLKNSLIRNPFPDSLGMTREEANNILAGRSGGAKEDMIKGYRLVLRHKHECPLAWMEMYLHLFMDACIRERVHH